MFASEQKEKAKEEWKKAPGEALKVSFVTLGCRVNQWDTQMIREQFQGVEVEEVPWGEGADIAVVNTCTVTAKADADARRLVRQAKRKNPHAFVVFTGCLAQDRPEQGRLAGADAVIGNFDKHRFMEKLHEAWIGLKQREGFRLWKAGELGLFGRGISRMEGRHRAFLKVQEGCRFACTFCLVPRVRGALLSRPRAELLEEAQRLSRNGAKEIVLVGIQLSSYGLDFGLKIHQPRLAPIVEEILRLPGVRRVRLSSYSAADFEDDLLSLIDIERGLAPHFHLPLQSGDAKILQDMRRPYHLEGFFRVVEKIKNAHPAAGLTTDVIVGFPGETDEAFANTLHMLRKAGFVDFHPFSYSDRPGTAAQAFQPKIPPQVVRERMHKLLSLREELRAQAAKRYAGAERWVIAEEKNGENITALSPEGLRLRFRAAREQSGDEVRLRLSDRLEDGTVWCEKI